MKIENQNWVDTTIPCLKSVAPYQGELRKSSCSSIVPWKLGCCSSAPTFSSQADSLDVAILYGPIQVLR